MNSIENIHNQAMNLARDANEALRENNIEKHKELCRQAFLLEKQAALHLISDFDAEPTRSVLFRSAASLAFNAELYSDARQMAHLGLSGNLYNEIKDELHDILRNISAIEYDKLQYGEPEESDEPAGMVNEAAAPYFKKNKGGITELPQFHMGKETANQQIKKYINIVPPVLEAYGDTGNTPYFSWRSKQFIESLITELDYLNADGVRIYLGIGENDFTINPIFIPTRAVDYNRQEDIILEEEPDFEVRQQYSSALSENTILGFNIAPPFPLPLYQIMEGVKFPY